MRVCVRCIVTGRVQGVFFRAFTQQQAQAMDIQGWARNLADGSVEVVACGEQGNVDKLRHWLHQGSPMSDVHSVEFSLLDLNQCPLDFSTA